MESFLEKKEKHGPYPFKLFMLQFFWVFFAKTSFKCLLSIQFQINFPFTVIITSTIVG